MHKALPPNTTEEENTTTLGQRRVNLIWEVTQAFIAVIVTGSMIYISVFDIDAEELKNAFFLIIGFYFSRTNHTAIGGIGKKPQGNYIGR